MDISAPLWVLAASCCLPRLGIEEGSLLLARRGHPSEGKLVDGEADQEWNADQKWNATDVATVRWTGTHARCSGVAGPGRGRHR